MPLRPCPVPAAATWPCGSCPWQGSLPPHASVWPGCRWAGEEVTGTSPSGSPGASAPSWNPGPICGDGSLHGAGTSQAGCPEGGPAWVSSDPTAQTLRAAPLELGPGTRCAPSREASCGSRHSPALVPLGYAVARFLSLPRPPPPGFRAPFSARVSRSGCASPRRVRRSARSGLLGVTSGPAEHTCLDAGDVPRHICPFSSHVRPP